MIILLSIQNILLLIQNEVSFKSFGSLLKTFFRFKLADYEIFDFLQFIGAVKSRLLLS